MSLVHYKLHTPILYSRAGQTTAQDGESSQIPLSVTHQGFLECVVDLISFGEVSYMDVTPGRPTIYYRRDLDSGQIPVWLYIKYYFQHSLKELHRLTARDNTNSTKERCWLILSS